MTWRDLDPPLMDLLAGFLVRVSSTVVMVRTDPGLAIVEANEAFRKLFHDWPPEPGTPLGEFLSMPDGSPPAPDPQAFDRDPVVLSVRHPLVLGTALRAFFFPYQGHCVLVGERVLPATAEALDVLTATSNELAALNRELRHRYREKAAALQDQVELMRNAEALGSIGWWEWDPATGRDRWSGNLFRLLGFEPDSVVPGLETWASALDPGERDGILSHVWQAMGEGRPFESEWRVPLAGGAERWLLMRAYPDRREDGSLLRYHGLVIDITQRKLAERRLKMSEEKFNRAFNAAPVIMTITQEEDGALLEVNDRFCALSGYAREDCIGRSTVELGWVDPENRDRLLRHLRLGGRAEGVELQVRSRDGEVIPVLAHVEQVRTDGVSWLVTTAVDQRERRRLEAERAAFEGQAQHLQRLETVGRLASGVAHDMNNVLAAITSMATVLRERDQRSGGDPRGAELILGAAERGTHLVRSLRDFSRKELQSGEVLDLNRLVRQEAELLEHTLLKQIDISVDLAPGLPPVFGDAGAISMALLNLAINACDAMPRGGTLVL
ncbi:MAG TPA: PAS domain S-box protein, partial [Holophaga sp.]|nr:PAS domain S-box protein [Holophaga sp.]